MMAGRLWLAWFVCLSVTAYTVTEIRDHFLAKSRESNFPCRTNIESWRMYWNAFQLASERTGGMFIPEKIESLREILYELVFNDFRNVADCNIGVIAGYSVVARYAVETHQLDLAYRSYQMAMVFVYTLRTRQRIPVRHEIEWDVSTQEIVQNIQRLKRQLPETFNVLPEVRSTGLVLPDFRDPRTRIAIVSICAYPQSHPLVLKDITPDNRKTYSRLHGYDAVVAMSHPLGDKSNVCIQHSKLALMKSVIETDKYDWVVWMDCDSIIVNHAKTIDSIIFTYARAETQIIITEELLGISSANWIIRASEWSIDFLERAFDIAHNELPLFGDQDAIISLAIGKGELHPAVAIVPQNELNAYDALNSYSMGSPGYTAGDLLVTFPQCQDIACNDLFMTAYNASRDNGESLSAEVPPKRSLLQLRVFGPPDIIGGIYSRTV